MSSTPKKADETAKKKQTDTTDSSQKTTDARNTDSKEATQKVELTEDEVTEQKAILLSEISLSEEEIATKKEELFKDVKITKNDKELILDRYVKEKVGEGSEGSQKQLETEVLKRRNAEQSLRQFKSSLKAKLDEFSQFLK